MPVILLSSLVTFDLNLDPNPSGSLIVLMYWQNSFLLSGVREYLAWGFEHFPFCLFPSHNSCRMPKACKSCLALAEGYVADEALTFCSRYFRGEIGTKFNRPTASQGCPRPTSDFQVFRSLCKTSGKVTIIRLGLQEMKKVIWYVLHNSPEIDAYMNEFKRYAFLF